MAVQDNIAAGYLSKFEGPIGVSVQLKLAKWPVLQQLGFAGALPHMNTTFHGLKDFKNQMSMYSSTHYILRAAWEVIKQVVPTNPSVLKRMFVSPVLGLVGDEFAALVGFGEAFGVPPAMLDSLDDLSGKFDTAASTGTLPFSSKGAA